MSSDDFHGFLKPFLLGIVASGSAALLYRQLTLPAPPDSFVGELEASFAIPPEQLYKIVQAIQRSMQKGLEKDNNPDIPMIPSFVTKLPTGKETGKFLAVDLGNG